MHGCVINGVMGRDSIEYFSRPRHVSLQFLLACLVCDLRLHFVINSMSLSGSLAIPFRDVPHALELDL
jgi:hypothetical protein